MSLPKDPKPEQPPMPAPGWAPDPPVVEPDPDDLPDEIPLPNPDENDGPPMHVHSDDKSL